MRARLLLACLALAALATAASSCTAQEVVPVSEIRLAVGYDHVCVLDDDGSISCESYGDSPYPAAPPGQFLSVSAAEATTCAIREDRTAACWSEWGGEVLEPPEGKFSVVAAGGRSACGLRADGKIECWGEIQPEPGSTPPDGQFRALSMNWDHACAIDLDGVVACWGVGGDRLCQMSNGHTDWCTGGDGGEKAHPPSMRVQAVDAGVLQTCAIREDSTVACWSDEEYVQAQQPPADVRFKSLSAGDAISCGISVEDRLICWGRVYGTPLQEPEGRYLIVDAGSRVICAVRMSGATECWKDAHLQETHYAGPESTTELEDATELEGTAESEDSAESEGRFLSVSAGHSICGVEIDGSLSCWGTDPYRRSWPADPPTGTYRSVITGSDQACAFDAGGGATCWDLGTGERVTLGSAGIKHVSFGSGVACVVNATGGIECFGSAGPRSVASLSPPDDGPFSMVAVGLYHACALRQDGQIRCWGEDHRQQTSPPAGSYRAISAGRFHTCALDAEGNVACWGSSSFGYSGRDLFSPLIAEPARQIEAGTHVTCALRLDDRVVCNGLRLGELAPPPDERFKAISVGSRLVCTIDLDDAVACRYAPPAEE